MPSSAISATVIAVLNHLLEPAPWARERLAGYAGSIVSLHAAGTKILFSISDTGRASNADAELKPSVTITVPLQSLPGMLSPASKALPANVRVEGSADLADVLGFVLRNLHWEAEEDLSRVFGDIVARRITLTAQSLNNTGARAVEAWSGNLSEHLNEMDAPVLGRFVHATFAEEIRTLRDAVARLDKRIERMS